MGEALAEVAPAGDFEDVVLIEVRESSGGDFVFGLVFLSGGAAFAKVVG